MFIPIGKYARAVALPPTTDTCARCGTTISTAWQRTWKTVHVFFFPLFSFGEKTTATCGLCHWTTPSRHPLPLAPLPFIDRVGFIFPLAAALVLPFALTLLGVVGLANAGGTLPSRVAAASPTQATAQRVAFERQVKRGSIAFQGPGGRELATEVRETFERSVGARSEDLGVAVRIQDRPGKITILCEYARLRDLGPKARRQLLADLKDVLRHRSRPSDQMTIALKGFILYGALATRPSDGDWNDEIAESVLPERVSLAVDAAGAPELERAE